MAGCEKKSFNLIVQKQTKKIAGDYWWRYLLPTENVSFAYTIQVGCLYGLRSLSEATLPKAYVRNQSELTKIR